MIDNFDQISKLLSFESDDEFYFVQILQRKKDNPDGKFGSNNSSRLIKVYYIKSVDHLISHKEEIITLCRVFNARAGINLNKRSFYKTAFNTLRGIAEQMHNREYTKIHRAWNTACGIHNSVSDKIWILDFDYVPTNPDWYIDIKDILFGLPPVGVSKILAFIPSKSGVHVITTGFDTREFAKLYPDIEIHKNNPTNLYIS